MRIKTLLCLAALTAAGVATSMAQSNVYSLNVVGYVNVPISPNGFAMIANPLNNANNNITNLFKAPFTQDGDQVYRWDAGAQDFSGTINTYSAGSSSWDSDFVLKPGEGVFYLAGANNATNTFTGDVVQGPYAVATLTGGGFSAIGAPVPFGGNHTNSILGLAPQDGDQVYTWDASVQDLSGNIATYSAGSTSWDQQVTLNAGLGFFYLGGGTNEAWSVNYSVPQTP